MHSMCLSRACSPHCAHYVHCWRSYYAHIVHSWRSYYAHIVHTHSWHTVHTLTVHTHSWHTHAWHVLVSRLLYTLLAALRTLCTLLLEAGADMHTLASTHTCMACACLALVVCTLACSTHSLGTHMHSIYLLYTHTVQTLARSRSRYALSCLTYLLYTHILCTLLALSYCTHSCLSWCAYTLLPLTVHTLPCSKQV